jgi:hypothetical protein
MAVALASLPSACREKESPVAELAAEPGMIELAYPEFTRVRFKWHILDELEGRQGEARVFVHLENANGEVVRTFDHDLPLPWRPGDRGEYDVVFSQSALVPALPVGEYSVTAGIYDAAGSRWPLAGALLQVRPGEYELATLLAGGERPSPKFYFSASWLPVEEGTDLQVLARRRLGESGSLRLAELEESGELWLRLGIPDQQPGEELMLEEGAVVPSVRISTGCGEYATEIGGAGSHEVVVPLEADGSGICDLEFSTNFAILSADRRSRQTVALEGMAWSRSPGSSSVSD